jgi:hypothetical protein
VEKQIPGAPYSAIFCFLSIPFDKLNIFGIELKRLKTLQDGSTSNVNYFKLPMLLQHYLNNTKVI